MSNTENCLYRGYILHNNDANEVVEVVEAPNGEAIWMSRQRLLEEIEARLRDHRSNAVVERDFEGCIEEVRVEFVAPPSDG